MSPLVESLKLKDGCICNMEFHNERLNRSMQELFPGTPTVDLNAVIQIPADQQTGLYKIRVLYLDRIQQVEITPYQFRTIHSLKVVRHNSIDYHLKYSDRELLNELYKQRGSCDDIIIVKNGLVGDSFAANLLFYDGNKWVTPDTPLLKGTQRQRLLSEGRITEKTIREADIRSYHKIGLINAMVSFEEMPVIPVEQVVYG